MNKHIVTNNYSTAILESWTEFKTNNFRINEYLGKKQLQFDWSFKKNYSGTGTIDYDECFKVKNVFGDNDSYLSLSMECRKKHVQLKPTDSLYNDSGLELVFQKILDNYFHN